MVELRQRPVGSVRISATDYAANQYLWLKVLAEPAVRSGQLRWVMEDWFRTFTGHHAYYPTRRQSSLAVRLVVEALRSKCA